MSNKESIAYFIKLLFPIMVIVLASDLLYLYFTHSWYDPIKIIEYIEVVVLFVLIILGIGYTYITVKVKR